MTKKTQNILIVRNDKIGDFTLILPAVASLKKNIPNSKVVCLVSKNVEELAQQCEFIDEVIVDASSVKGQSQPIIVHSKTDNKSKTNKTSAA